MSEMMTTKSAAAEMTAEVPGFAWELLIPAILQLLAGCLKNRTTVQQQEWCEQNEVPARIKVMRELRTQSPGKRPREYRIAAAEVVDQFIVADPDQIDGLKINA